MKNNWQIVVYKTVSPYTTITMTPNYMVDIDVNDFNTAIIKTQELHKKITSILSNISYIRDNVKIHPLKFYHFKITNNLNGVYICLSPQTMNKGFEVYNINNNVTNFSNVTYCKNSNEIIDYINRTMYANEFLQNRINYIKKVLLTFNTGFVIGDTDYNTIGLMDIKTKNAYMIKFSLDYYTKIYIVQNGKYFEQHKTTCITKNLNEFLTKMKEYLSNNVHNISIKMIKIYHPMYNDSDDESTPNEIRELHSKHRVNYYCDDPR